MRCLIPQSHLHEYSFHIISTQGNFREMEWGVATLWQLRGLAIGGWYGISVLEVRLRYANVMNTM